jgi:hypothetical protein
MHRLLTPLVISIMLAAARADEPIAPQLVDGPIAWTYSYAAGKEQARRTGRPMFVVFRCER